MIKVLYPLLDKTAWHCLKCMSENADNTTKKQTAGKPVFVELFSGSGEVAAAARAAGFETVTVDIEKKHKPDLLIDVQRLRKQMLPEHVDVVWASVPCTVFSTLSISAHWQKVSIGWRQYQYIPKTPEAVTALRILNKTLRLIRELKPTYYFIENPRGALRHFPQMILIPYRKTVSYADYGFTYYKPTDIFTNCHLWKPTELKGMQETEYETQLRDVNGAANRSLIPKRLIDEILDSLPFASLRRKAERE